MYVPLLDSNISGGDFFKDLILKWIKVKRKRRYRTPVATKALATSPRISFYLMIYEYTQSLDLVKAAVHSPS